VTAPLRRIVVVGGSAAGATAAGALRRLGHTGPLTLVGAEPHAPYSRPALSKGILTGADDASTIRLAPLPADVAQRTGVAAVSLDHGRREVLLDDGERVGYDGLVLATGARAATLTDIGSADPGAIETVLRDLDDARALAARLATRPRVLVVGGGVLGTEVASACVAAGCEVTVVGRDAPLLPQLGAHLADVVVAAARRLGVRFAHHEGGVRLRGAGRATTVDLADGRRFEADLVITAIGCRPNVEWLGGSGLLPARHRGGLAVDDRCRLAPGVVAAGDVAAFPGPTGHRRSPLWTSAIEQAGTAAAALLGADTAPLVPRPYFWTEQFGLALKVCGALPVAGPPAVVDGDPDVGGALLRWPGTTAVSINQRVPIARLRALALAG
jgi:3-phenylpropionate/trans-cinnamate dioxygenase ferredoxin reductase component